MSEQAPMDLGLEDAREGRHRYSLTTRDFSYPSGLVLEDIQPQLILLDIEKKPSQANENPRPG